MAQQANPSEARTETTTLGMTSTVVPVGLEAIAKKMKGGDNKTAALHLGEDSAYKRKRLGLLVHQPAPRKREQIGARAGYAMGARALAVPPAARHLK